VEEVILSLRYTRYPNFAMLPEVDKQLITRARKAVGMGYAPYSTFRVGAAVLLQNGMVITGNNQENAAYPSGQCAERTALFYAASQYPGVPILAIAVSNYGQETSAMAKPCGACRQVMSEYEDLADQPLHIILDGSDQIIVLEGIDNLLPLRFSRKDLI